MVINKRRWVFLGIIVFFLSFSYAYAWPPSPPNINLTPPVPKCALTNGGVEICDNVDNDCNGKIDDNLNTSVGCNQMGYCYGSYKVCIAGDWSACSKLPGQETCNAVDDDCNNLVDDGVNRSTTCGLGECSGNIGVQVCVIGEWTLNTCNPFEGAVSEICEGSKDEDCDGTIDENCTCTTGSIKACGYNSVGACKMGNQTCDDGVWSSVCIGVVNPVIESCDGIDNDCDGNTDENLTDTSNCSQLGICRGSFKTCNEGAWSICSIISASETCNNLDDDCDGDVDENDVCYVPSPRTDPDDGGDTGERPYVPPASNENKSGVPNQTNPSEIVDNKSAETQKESIVNNSLIQVVPLQDKVENISKSGANTNLFSFFKDFSTKKIIWVGGILAAIIIFLSVFIIDFSKRKRMASDEKYLNSLYTSGLTYLGIKNHKGRAAKALQTVVRLDQKNNLNTPVKNYSGTMTVQEINAMKYIDAMRQRGYNDEYIMNQLRIKGWKEEFIRKFFMN